VTSNPTIIPSLPWKEVCARRLDRHVLSAPAQGAGPSDIARAIGVVHAQIMSAAELSIGLRTGVTRATIQDTLWSERSLVKTFGPRGTVHLLPASDLPIWTGALSAIPRSHSGHTKDARLAPEQMDEVVAAIAGALEDAELTVDELSKQVIARTGPWAGAMVMPAFGGMWPRWRQAIGTAANRGVLCFGPNRGRNVTFTNPRRWLPDFRPADERSALAGVVRRYLYAYGPATPQQFAQWLGAPRSWTSDLFDSLAAELQPVEMEGTRAWVLAGDTAVPSTVPSSLCLLPYFDSYVVGCHPRALLFPGRAAERALAGGQAGNFPVLLIDGVVAGIWHHRRSGRYVDITVEPLEPLTTPQRRLLDEQVEHIVQVLVGKPRLTIGAVTVGAHA
jgi:hypothetical protein